MPAQHVHRTVKLFRREMPDFIITANLWLLNISAFTPTDYWISVNCYNILCKMFISWGNIWLIDKTRQFSSWLYPLPTKIFCRFLWFGISIFYFNLFPALKSVHLALKQHTLIVLYGTDFKVPKFLSGDILQNPMQKQHYIHLLLNIKHLNTHRVMSSSIKKV